MALGYAENHVFEIAIYTETCVMKGRVCQSPEDKYGEDWRESADLETFKGTATSLIADALEKMNIPRVGMHMWTTSKNVVEYLGETVVKHSGKYMLESDMLTPPVLDIDTRMANEFGHKVHARGKIERRVVWNLISYLSGAGWKPVSVDDGEEETAVADAKAMMEIVFNVDDCWCFFANETGTKQGVRIVLGNDGWDAVSDYHIRVAEFEAVMNMFDGEKYA